MNRKIIKIVLAAVVLSVSSFANAALIKYIEISSASGDYLQVSELVAWGANTNSDLALTATATATATSFYNGSCNGTNTANCVLDGSGAMAWMSFYHGNDDSEVLTVTFNVASAIKWFEIFGRAGTCCDERDVYNVSLFDTNGDVVRSFSSLSAINEQSSTGRVNVPEPSTVAIFALGFLGLAARRFKK